ncbi:hypothetical protein BsWGS_15972 [Bradybaena similaris]
MAERGVEGDNPFSFKKFVSSKDKPASSGGSAARLNDTGDDLDDIFAVGEVKHGATKGAVLSVSREDSPTQTAAQTGSHKKDKQKDNPFSFKKFLSSGVVGTKKGSNSSLASFDNSDPDAPYSSSDQAHLNSRTLDQVNGVYGSNTDKSFKPDSFHVEATSKESVAPLDLPSFLDGNLKTSGEFNPFHFHEEDEASRHDGRRGSRLSVKDAASSGPLALPDFLSDTAMVNERQAVGSTADNSARENIEDLLDRIHLLQEENDTLRSELSRERQKSHDKNLRLSQLKIDLERQKKKEAEDMAVLEKAVLQVEENLVTTTTRAVQAEATVTKLKQEVKSLQKQVVALSAETEAYRSGDHGLADIRERTKYTADELKSAAVIAERNIKELMAGVDKLKLLSQVLSSLEKVTDIIPESSPEDDTKPS